MLVTDSDLHVVYRGVETERFHGLDPEDAFGRFLIELHAFLRGSVDAERMTHVRRRGAR